MKRSRCGVMPIIFGERMRGSAARCCSGPAFSKRLRRCWNDLPRTPGIQCVSPVVMRCFGTIERSRRAPNPTRSDADAQYCSYETSVFSDRARIFLECHALSVSCVALSRDICTFWIESAWFYREAGRKVCSAAGLGAVVTFHRLRRKFRPDRCLRQEGIRCKVVFHPLRRNERNDTRFVDNDPGSFDSPMRIWSDFPFSAPGTDPATQNRSR